MSDIALGIDVLSGNRITERAADYWVTYKDGVVGLAFTPIPLGASIEFDERHQVSPPTFTVGDLRAHVCALPDLLLAELREQLSVRSLLVSSKAAELAMDGRTARQFYEVHGNTALGRFYVRRAMVLAWDRLHEMAPETYHLPTK